jgi:DNA polymerase-3 subunit alpha
VRPTITRQSNRKMAMVTVSDRRGAIDGVLFPDVYAKYGDLLQADRCVLLWGHADRSRAEPCVVVEKVIAIEQAAQFLGTRLDLVLDGEPASGEPFEPLVNLIAGTLRKASGSVASLQGRPVDVSIHVDLGDDRVTLVADRIRVVPDATLLGELGRLLGADRVHVRGGHRPAKRQPRQWEQKKKYENDPAAWAQGTSDVRH